jgi:anti-sigma regulatory factor (Ser/Thr protein kinase)
MARGGEAAAREPAPGESRPARVFAVAVRTDVVVASREAREWAESQGLGRRRSTEIAIVVSELASNIVKHAGSGRIVLDHDSSLPPRGELVVAACDAGPPIRDLATALTDGCDDLGPIDPALLLGRRGLGTGLGAVARLADRFDCRQDGSGKTLTARFRL